MLLLTVHIVYAQYDLLSRGCQIYSVCAGLTLQRLPVLGHTNISAEVAVFEAVHGSTPKYAGKNAINFIAVILSVVLMLRHLPDMAQGENWDVTAR